MVKEGRFVYERQSARGGNDERRPDPNCCDPDCWPREAACRPTTEDLTPRGRIFVAQGSGATDSPWDKLVSGLYLGSEAFIERVKALTGHRTFTKEHLKLQQYVSAVDLVRVREAVQTFYGVMLTARRWKS